MRQRSTSEIIAAVRIAAAPRKYNAVHQSLLVDDITDGEIKSIRMQAVENSFYTRTFTKAEDVIHFLDNGDA